MKKLSSKKKKKSPVTGEFMTAEVNIKRELKKK